MIDQDFQKNILVPMLEHFVGNHVFGIKMLEDSVLFKTDIGANGLISKNINGDWDIIIGDEVVYELEDELLNVLIPGDEKFQIDDYYQNLNNLLNSDLKYRSKSLVIQIVRTLQIFILNAEIKPINPIIFGPFQVYTSKISGKNIIYLN
jgi:hypothetical protein